MRQPSSSLPHIYFHRLLRISDVTRAFSQRAADCIFFYIRQASSAFGTEAGVIAASASSLNRPKTLKDG